MYKDEYNEENRQQSEAGSSSPQDEQTTYQAGPGPEVQPPQKPVYEPWREPVYREAEPDSSNTYSPGHYARGYESRTAPVPQSASRERPPKAPKARLGVVRTIALLLACAVVGGAVGGASSYFVSERVLNSYEPKQVVIGGTAPATSSGEDTGAVKTVVSEQPVRSNGQTLTGNEVYQLACQQVVGVKTSVTTTNIFGMRTTGAVSGSGFIISEDGYIITNYHVVEYADKYGYPLSVLTYDGTSYEATIVGYEESNDIAVIKIDAEGLNPAVLGDSDQMLVGETIYAVGNPLGMLTYTMTTGSVSASDRVINTEETSSLNVFQIDAAINGGNSGGPVYNDRGEVLGVVVAKKASVEVEGIAFAIPINDAKKIATDLITKGYVTGKAYIGVIPQNVEAYVSQYYNIPQGAYVASVVENTPAEAVGLKRGDVITKVGEYDVTGDESLRAALKHYHPGETIDLEVYRNGETVTVTVTLAEATPETKS